MVGSSLTMDCWIRDFFFFDLLLEKCREAIDKAECD